MKNIKKKRIITMIVLGLLIIMAAVGITLAVLKKNSEQRANNFTFGNVKIELREPEWEELDPKDKIVYPGRTVKKDPFITNTGGKALYAYIEVKIPRAWVRTVSEDGSTIYPAAWQNLFEFEHDSSWTCISEEISADNAYTVQLYAFTKEDGVLEPGEWTTELFQEVTYANVLEGEIEKNTVLEMPIAAYAIQAEKLNESGATTEEKMRDAFAKYRTETGK